MSFARTFIRLKFSLTSRSAADQLIRDELKKTIAVAGKLGPGGCRQSAKIPQMVGIDDDMREWNYYQILEHNTIVNNRIAQSVLFLTGKGPKPSPNFNIKTDVMPAPNAGMEQIEFFEKSVEEYLQLLTTVSKLRGTETSLHPIFGLLDAHKMHCLFGFHLQLHRKQAEALIPLVGEADF